MSRILMCSLVVLVALPGVANAAAKPGSYRGTSQAKIPGEYGIGSATDKGRVTFTVRGRKVLKLRLKGQLFTCADRPWEIAVSVRQIKLNSSGKGSANYTSPEGFRFKVTIAVGSSGRATGKVRGSELCDAKRPATFTAKRS